ncbi:vacuolar protein sorting-associated VTA1-like protein [Ceratobasidium sp. AG-Ba]|nr:vacuolar protein sorting-associated VTA1-like protein [Ceratobasidium sp. AG-Ba]
MPLPPLPPELKAIAPFLQRADEMRGKDPVISFWCEYYAVKKGLSLRQSSESRSFLLQLMDSLEATKKALADREAINNDDAGHLYVENFADRIFIMADEEDRRGATARSTAKKFLAAGQFYDILSVFEGTKQTQGPKTSEKRTYAKWRATEISKAFRDNRTPPPPPSPGSKGASPLPISAVPTDPNGSQTLTASSVSSLPPVGTSSTPPLPSARSPTAQSPTNIPTTITITSPGPGSGTASPGGSGSGTPHRRRASDVSASTPTRLAAGTSPAWSTRVQATPDPPANGVRPRESSPAKDRRARRGSTDPGTEDDDSAAGSGGVNGSSRRLFNAPENGHEANGESWSNGAGWDVRQASLAVQPPESRQSSFAQRPADVSLPVSPPATGPMPQILGSPTSSNFSNGPPALISGPVQHGSAPSSQSSSRHTSPRSAEPAIPQTPGKQSSPISSYSTPGRASPPSAPPPSVATPSSSHTSITPTGSPAATEDSPATTPTSGPTITVSGQQPTSLVLPPRRVHFSGSTVGGLSSVASSEASSSPYSSPGHTPTELPPNHMPLQITGPPSNVSPTHSRHYEPTPRAPAAILPPPDLSPETVLPPLSGALVRPQSYQNPRVIVPNVAYPTASAPPYPEPTYPSPPPLVHHGHPHHHHQHSSSQSLVHVPQAQSQGGSGGYSYVPATPATPPLPLAISGQATQRAQKHAKFAISALDYDDLDTARKELMNALAIVNGRSGA